MNKLKSLQLVKATRINDIKVKPVITNQEYEKPERILGYDWFPRLYSNIALISKKNSGKTTIIYRILEHCADKNSRIIFFCPTAHIDATYKAIFGLLEKKGIEYEVFDSIKDPDDRKHDLLQEIVEQLQSDAGDADEPEPPKDKTLIRLGNGQLHEVRAHPVVAKERKPRKPKKLSPEIIFVFDDCSQELRNRSVATLLKKNRHLKSKIIMSSQQLTDLDNASRSQLDYFLCFKSLTEPQLETIYSNMHLAVDEEKFKQLYAHATAEPFNFLYVDVRKDTFRQNFNLKLE